MNSSVPLLPCTIKKKAKVICFFFLHITPSSHLTLFRYPPFFFVCYTDRCSAFFLLLFAFSFSYAEQCFGVSFPYSWASLFLFVVFWRFNFFFLVLFLRNSVFLSLFFFSVPPCKKKQWPAFEQQRKAAFWTTKQMRTQKHSGRTRKKNGNPPKIKKKEGKRNDNNNNKKKELDESAGSNCGKEKGERHSTQNYNRTQKTVFFFLYKKQHSFFFYIFQCLTGSSTGVTLSTVLNTNLLKKKGKSVRLRSKCKKKKGRRWLFSQFSLVPFFSTL